MLVVMGTPRDEPIEEAKSHAPLCEGCAAPEEPAKPSIGRPSYSYPPGYLDALREEWPD